MAEIEIHARTPGMLVIDLVYAKPQEWPMGCLMKVAQVFLLVSSQ